MTEQPLSVRTYNSAVMMYNGRGPHPQLEDFAHLDVAAASVASTPAAGPATPTAPAPPAAGWDVAAFDALPPETRAAVMSGAAHQLGRGMLELEAQQVLVRPEDVHLHLTDPSKYVDSTGRVDHDAIRTDLHALTTQRPEIGKSSDPRPRAVPGALVGAQPDPTRGLAHRVAAAAAVMNNPRQYGQS